MLKNIQREISRNVPRDIPIRLNSNTIPLFTAYGCVLLERDTGRTYIYTAVNLKTGLREVISRRPTPLTTSGVGAMAEKIRLSNVAGAGRLQADRPYSDKIALDNCIEMLETVFNEILPQHGYAVRMEQISLAKHILGALSRRHVSLAEAEVGTGKTLAYLVASVLAKRGHLNGFWNMSFYTGTPYVDMANMPIVIATSSIALQKALVTDYIPELSNILMEHSIIKTPLTCTLRKGREHYICEHNLRTQIAFTHSPEMKERLIGLLKPGAAIDLAEIDAGPSGAGLNAYVKRRICVPKRCERQCPHRKNCQYLQFRELAASTEIDIQVVNHNYLLADTLRRRDDKPALIPNYQSIIIDEAHKFLGAARSMYGVELSSLSLSDIEGIEKSLNFRNERAKKLADWLAGLLADENKRLFKGLVENTANHEDDNAEDESDRFPALIDNEAQRHLFNVFNISGELMELLSSEPLAGNGAGRRAQILWELERIRGQVAALIQHDELICWIDVKHNEVNLCAIQKNLDQRLYDDLWSKGIPTVLTSGTLSAGGDFSHIKRALGIDRIGSRLTATSKPSPFDYRSNSRLYISDKIPFPDYRNSDYILAVANEIEQLIYASHGHAAVLFTSYKVMDMVWKHLEECGIPFPLFRLDKGGVKEIERFKKSGNGIMFAAGALWEGIDIPGDTLSMLIIVKLPFAVPDPISEYERTLYPSVDEYISRVVVPEMLIKLKQGFGRLIRTEKDKGAVAILDCRVGQYGAYRGRVFDALPDCCLVKSIEEIEDFIRTVKDPGYFE